MRYVTGKIAEAALGLLMVGLAVALVIPWPEERLPSVEDALLKTVPDAPREDIREGTTAAPELVARLFGWSKRPPAPVVPEPVETEAAPPPVVVAKEPPVAVPWLKYVGYATDAEGSPLYYLKDTRNGKVIRVAPGSASTEWSLLEVTEERLVVRFGDDEYVVDRR